MTNANSYSMSRDELINALLTFAGPQVLYADLPDEVRRVCKLAADALDGPNDDAERLWFVSQMMDGIGDIDFHERAFFYADNEGRTEPTKDDYLEAVRDAIDSALTRCDATPQPSTEVK